MADTSKITLRQLKDAMNKAKKYTDNEIAGVTGVSKVEPEELDMPKVFFNGDKPTNKTSVHATIEYISKNEHFKGYVDIKCQGNSSMAYPKKNYTIKMFKDEARSTKLKKDFKGWGKQSKFCLKANYIDHSHARNIISAKLWGQVVKSRSDFDTLPEELKTSPNYGAVDGFPIKVYYNNTYEGVYTWNIPKDGWMNNMDDKLNTHCILCGEEYNSGCFRSANASLWSDELHDVMPANIVTSFNNFQNFVINSSDDEFKTGLSTYADVNSLIDYYIFQYVICGLDSMGKNQLFFTYDGIKWIASSYDMDSTFGMYWNGQSFVSATYRMQEDYESMTSGRPGNLLYIRMEELFYDEIKARYAELRAGVLSYANIVNEFERFMDVIGKDLYAEDLTIYTSIPSGNTNNIQQIRNYTRDRLAYVDTQIESLAGPVEEIPCTSISLDKDTLALGVLGSTSESTSEKINLLTGVNSSINSSGNLVFDTVTLEAGVYEISNINGGTFKWLGYTINGVKAEPSGNTTFSVTFLIRETTDVIINAYPDNNETNTADKLALYKFMPSNPQQFTQAGTGYFDNSGNIVENADNVYSESISLDPTKKYAVEYNGSATITGQYIVLKIDNTIDKNHTPLYTGQIIKVIENASTLALSVNASSCGLPDIRLMELKIAEGIPSINSYQLTATVTPENCTQPVVWSVSPEGIVTVNNGLVTAVTNGEATVTATCGTQSANCNVTVTGIDDTRGLLYELPEAKTFNGTSDYIDTGIALCSTDQDYTILCEFTADDTKGGQQMALIHCMHEVMPYSGLAFQRSNNTPWRIATGSPDTTIQYNTDGVTPLVPYDANIHKIAIVRNGGSISLACEGKKISATYTHKAAIENLLLGAYQTTDGAKGRFFAGTISQFKVYNYAFDNAQIQEFVGEISESDGIDYELPEAKTFNGAGDYLDTGVRLLSGDNLNKDWTMLIDFTPTSLTLASIIHCMTEVSPWPGIYLSLNNDGAVQMVFPNNAAKNNIITATVAQRIKFVIKKVGTTFAVYDSTMTLLHSNDPNPISTTPNSVLLGAIQVYNNGTQTMSYSRFFNGTIHKFKIVEGDMSNEDCLNWMGAVLDSTVITNESTPLFKVDATCLNAETNTLTDSVAGISATLAGTPTINDNQMAFTASDTFNFDISSLDLNSKNITFRIKFTPTTLDGNYRNVFSLGLDTNFINTYNCYIHNATTRIQYGKYNGTNVNNDITDATTNNFSQSNHTNVTPLTVNTECEIILSVEYSTHQIRVFKDGELIQNGKLQTIYRPLRLSNLEGATRFVGKYSLIELYHGFMDSYVTLQ